LCLFPTRRSSDLPAQSFDLCSGLPLRLVEAISSSSFSLIDLYIDFEAPFSSLTLVSPRLADRAAPAAFCCAADFAGMTLSIAHAPDRRGSPLANNREAGKRFAPANASGVVALTR